MHAVRRARHNDGLHGSRVYPACELQGPTCRAQNVQGCSQVSQDSALRGYTTNQKRQTVEPRDRTGSSIRTESMLGQLTFNMPVPPLICVNFCIGCVRPSVTLNQRPGFFATLQPSSLSSQVVPCRHG